MGVPTAITDVATTPVTRRRFMQWSAVAGGTTGVMGLGACGLQPQDEKTPEAVGDKSVWSACNVNCGSRCPLQLVVAGGQIVRVDPDNRGSNEIGDQQVRACVRGRSIRQRIYSPERLKKPLKRVGARGEGKWAEIEWDEAFTLIADKLTDLIAEHGNESIYLNYGTGVIGATVAKSWPPRATAVSRLMNCIGGYLDHYNDYSAGNIEAACDFHYGSYVTSNSNDDTRNAKLVVMFGNNPHETRMSGGGEVFVTQQAKKQSGHKVIVIDPRQSETVMNLADEWVPIRPGTDLALVAGMAHVMIEEGLQDQEFLDTYCSGFDEDHMPEGAPANSSYASYILGLGEDGVEKTPEWAASITGLPASRIRSLAREIATTKPCAINAGWGIQRHSNGESQSRAPMLLSNMIGQVGIPGGGTGAREGSASLPMAGFPVLENPVRPVISYYQWPEAIVNGKGWTYKDGVRDLKDLNSNANVTNDVTLNSNIKFIWNYGSNALVNQHGDINKTIKLLSDESLVEMIVVIDTTMSVSARYADIVLPDASTAEQVDLSNQGSAGNMGYAIFTEKAIEPLYESMPVYEQLTGIAEKLGVKDKFTEGRTQDDWVRWLLEESRKNVPDLPAYDEFREMGVFRKKLDPVIALKDFRDDPVANPLGTPSGKIEIWSSNLHKMSLDWNYDDDQWIDPLPIYRRTRELHGDPLQAKYPIQVIGHHFKQRTHSSYGNSPWLKEAHPQRVWINTLDADKRGIKEGDLTRVYNDFGELRLPAYVTNRILPGVSSVPQGAWYTPEKPGGVDVGGSVNTLTSHQTTAYAKGNGQHSALVQIERA
ncbi:DMSO/selenate family reductase complex A subunit [Tessaracoccus antarcticus]|uniref:Dimethyl sulfoxide reductase subunit A n=1 Tax=Tessaracoccus antarcticus TaxID=2479848 RepID=A0A3M0GB18_9ACTN|nr:DMSO/selenate family reductase complex A subunit [Tessaracoccus antarcticus]RMB62120.1 dimethyl sulfoxide reductase subunit A [Tessaracoccus antarcticus]